MLPWSCDRRIRAPRLLAIDREDEYHNTLAAAETGVGPPVVEYRPELGALVVGFVVARTCSKIDLTDSSRMERIITACRRLHGGARFRNCFDMFRLQPFYLKIVQDNGFRLPARYMGLHAPSRADQARLAPTGTETVPCAQRPPA